jgi:hypothetical protein
MSLEPVLLRDYKRDKPPTKWCVYFDDETGDIVTVTNRKKDFLKESFIETDDNNAKLMLMGEVDPKKFSVVEIEQQLKLVEKSAVLRIKKAENRLSIVPLSAKKRADVNITMYLNSWKMEVNFNQDTLYRMTGKRYFKNVSLNPEQQGKYDPIVFYLIKNNDPNHLLRTIEIDPGELIEEGYLIFDMSPLRSYAGLGEISILTKKIFSSYGLTRKSNFTGTDYTTRFQKRRMFSVPTPQQKQIDSQFTVFYRNNRYYLKSNFDDPQEEKIYSDIAIYLTDKTNPSNLLGHLTLPVSDIGWKSTIELDTTVNLFNCGILASDATKNISIDYITEGAKE